MKKKPSLPRLFKVGLRQCCRRHWRYLEPKFLTAWIFFREKIELFFALSDRSALGRPLIVLRITFAFIGILIVWSIFFDIDQVISAQGQVIANSRSQIVQAVDAGVLVSMKVEEGDFVEQGQIIAMLEKERATAAYTESYGKVAALTMTVRRLQSEISEKEFTLDPRLSERYPDLAETQKNLFNQRRNGFINQVSVLKDNVKLAEQELSINLPLEKLGDVSKMDVLRLKKAVNEARGAYVTQRNKYFQDASAELNKAEEDLNIQEQILLDRGQILEHTDIVAPATGIIKSVRMTTLGGVLKQGDEILQILPTESALVVEAKIKPSDMGHLKVGLPVKVKLDAYDFSIFGAMKGRVTYISPDTLFEETKLGSVPYYRVKVNIGERDFKSHIADDLEVRPGMTATVDIKTGSRSVFAFLFKPISKAMSRSMGEK